MDYDFLRREGFRHLERMVGSEWTDFNAHDPGITILEQVCYALSDLGYRIAHDMPDLLASGGGDPSESLYPPAEILSTCPVTLSDLRRLVLDVPGVKNAWIEPLEETLHYNPHPDYQELLVTEILKVTEPVTLVGRYNVVIEPSSQDESEKSLVRAKVARRLLCNRSLGDDLIDVTLLTSQSIRITATIEIAAADDDEQLYLDILEQIADHISPPIPFTSLDQKLAAGQPIEEIFNGPRLDSGFIEDEALVRHSHRSALTTSDLIHEIMEVPEVRAVRSISISSDGESWKDWYLELEPSWAPYLLVTSDSVSLIREGITVRFRAGFNPGAALEQRRQARAEGTRGGLATGTLTLAPGRDRRVGDYLSIQHQLPAAYGLADMGLPSSASPQRRARSRQLRAYLTFFDQILADSFAQLEHSKDLFSYRGDDLRTYFTQELDDPALGLDEILTDVNDNGVQGMPSDGRKNRFLNHLLARFAEQLGDHPLTLAGDPESRRVRDKQAFLQRYPRISSARGIGFDQLAPAGSSELSGLEERLRLKLGLESEQELLLIEHALFGPIAGDFKQTVPLLAATPYPDPYSLQLSVLLPLPEPEQDELRGLVERTLREEAPAHLIVSVHWLDAADWSTLSTAYQEWREWRRRFLCDRYGIAVEPPEPADAPPTHLHLRDARDRLIELLGFGDTYPIQDLVVPQSLRVLVGDPAEIPINPSQSDVRYELHYRNLTPVPGTEPMIGNGATITLTKPEITEDITFRILASKIDNPQRKAYLHQEVEVLVGINQTLAARIIGAELLVFMSNPPDTDPRIIDYGGTVEVEIDGSQEGVKYQLVEVVNDEDVALSTEKVGIGGTITLETVAVLEDTDIRIRATKTYEPPDSVLLDVVLPLKVRANPNVAVSVDQSLIAFGESPVVVIAGSQESVSYQVYLRRLWDGDFLYGGEPAPGNGEVLEVTVTDEVVVRVRRPPRSAVWNEPTAFTPALPKVSGNGGELRLTLPKLDDDSVAVIAARKEHTYRSSEMRTSELQLAQALLLLLRPDPGIDLLLEALVVDDQLAGTVEVSGGQPGVFYYLRVGAEGAELALPGYFFERDVSSNGEFNKGIDQLRIEVDFVIARDPAVPHADPTRDGPPAPWVELGSLPLSDTALEVYVRAVRARTRVDAQLSRCAAFFSVPEIKLVPEHVAAGDSVEIHVDGGSEYEWYQPFVNGEPIADAREWKGLTIVFLIEAVTETTTFEVHVTRPDDPGLVVTRFVELTVTVNDS